MNQYQVLQNDHEDVKKKLEGSKARNKVLSNEVKTLKEQISTLMEKGKHDNELVDALVVRSSRWWYSMLERLGSGWYR